MRSLGIITPLALSSGSLMLRIRKMMKKRGIGAKNKI